MDWSTVVNSATENAVSIVESIGEAALHAISPDSYEYYLCSLELRTVAGTRVGFISFTVMPNNITESQQPIQTQTKTQAGIVTLYNDSFVPSEISIQGTFGRRFRLVSGNVDPAAADRTGWGNFFNGNFGSLVGTNVSLTGGYGLTKILQHICSKSNETDDEGNPYILIFTNYAFNTAYVVDVVNASFNAGIENNRMWFYELSLRTVAPATAVTTVGALNGAAIGTVAASSIAQGITNILYDVARDNNLFVL